jgi:ankyrin repeat protein
MNASGNGHTDIVKLLLEAGANKDAANDVNNKLYLPIVLFSYP